jgi:heme exporter protein D
MKTMTFGQLVSTSMHPVAKSIRTWWLRRVERHYAICADVEMQRAREAQLNAAYYQKRAALARSARID